jgi:hypothetical protein
MSTHLTAQSLRAQTASSSYCETSLEILSTEKFPHIPPTTHSHTHTFLNGTSKAIHSYPVFISTVATIWASYTNVYLAVHKTLFMHNAVFLDVMLCGSCENRRFGGMYCLHHRVTRIGEIGTMSAVTNKRNTLADSCHPYYVGNISLRNVDSYKSHMGSHPRIACSLPLHSLGFQKLSFPAILSVPFFTYL